MENEKDLDLSLGLPCGGGSSSSLKGKHGSSSDNKLDEGDRGSKLINEFKTFLEGGIQHPLKPDENFYNSFPKAVVDVETSKNSNSGGVWMTNDSRSTEVEEENRSSLGEKRKNVFTETNEPKKLERETSHPELSEKTRVSHISITTDEGSTAENEDVADSEVDGSTSRQVSQQDEVSKRFVASGSISRTQKEIHAFGDRSGAELLGPKRFNISSEKEMNMMNMNYGVSFPGQAMNMVNMSYSQPGKDSNTSSTASMSSYPLPGMMHPMAAANSERQGMQPVVPANFPMFGYSSVQLPGMEKDNSRGILSHHQQILPTYSGRNPINLDAHNESRKLTQATTPVISHKSSESTQYDGRRAVEHGKTNGKQHVGEEGSSSYTEGEMKGNQVIHQVKDASDQPRTEPFPSEFPAIRPGIAADLKFGGCGTYPNLPWVSTTSPGPNGKTISGVTYRFSPTQIRIVCACHGSHLSPEEFVRHASEENTTQDSGTGLASLPNSNPAASAQS
ncbi:hypothetical protein RD792_014650 [Penstemon davidsonii]|uniref:Ninja-family protein n=1 Tax=Penstemon davidsonii TaxID=160366 RepID=A0ABR0CQ29_9LAMI|nr:hypothetical protein RD792_014650 [Penstemon davidsonii]